MSEKGTAVKNPPDRIQLIWGWVLRVLPIIVGLSALGWLLADMPVPVLGMTVPHDTWFYWLFLIAAGGVVLGGAILLFWPDWFMDRAYKLVQMLKRIWTAVLDQFRLITDTNESLPPLSPLGLLVFWFLIVSSGALIVYLILKHSGVIELCPSCNYIDYISFIWILISVYYYFYFLHPRRVYFTRLIDRDEVRSILSDMQGILAKGDVEEPMKAHMASEISNMDGVGYMGWTEYRVLILDLLRVEPMGPQELAARARNTIDGLREYADDTEHPYPKEDFSKIENRFQRLIDDVERPGKLSPDEPTALAMLRSELKELLEHIASVDRDWQTGKVVLNSLVACSILSLLTFFLMGILPIINIDFRIISIEGKSFSGKVSPLRIENYAFLAASGAVLAVLNVIARSDQIDVGNETGRRITIRAAIGIGMGLIAGALAFALAGSGLLGGRLIPDLTLIKEAKFEDYMVMIYLGILYAFLTGFTLDRFYERFRGMN